LSDPAIFMKNAILLLTAAASLVIAAYTHAGDPRNPSFETDTGTILLRAEDVYTQPRTPLRYATAMGSTKPLFIQTA